jgi:hypothetical protein
MLRFFVAFIASLALTFALAVPALAKGPAPVPITIIVTNTDEVAKAHENAILVGVAGLFVDIDARVLDEIVSALPGRLQAQGVQAVVGRLDVTISPTGPGRYWLWNATTQELSPAAMREGSYRAILVTVLNPEDLVRDHRGGATLLAGRILQMDLGSKVNEACAAAILKELQAEGINALVSFERALP